MKLSERINSTLLCTLWILSIVLVLDFWLNTAYNFNMFSNAHWQHIASLQAQNKPIKTGFYIAIALAISGGIFGLYMLLRPKTKKSTPDTETHTDSIPVPDTPEPQPVVQTIPSVAQPAIQRPPHLHIQASRPLTPPKPVQTATPISQTNKPVKPQYTDELKKIFEDNKYRVLNPKTIANVQLSLIALGTNETLWLGACDISHEQMADVMLAFQSIFKETLEDIDIDINSFIINPSDDEFVDSIIDCKSIDELSNVINKNPNKPESESDKEAGNMDAFAGYIETVITYLGNK